jgi:hypothetical protein
MTFFPRFFTMLHRRKNLQLDWKGGFSVTHFSVSSFCCLLVTRLLFSESVGSLFAWHVPSFGDSFLKANVYVLWPGTSEQLRFCQGMKCISVKTQNQSSRFTAEKSKCVFTATLVQVVCCTQVTISFACRSYFISENYSTMQVKQGIWGPSLGPSVTVCQELTLKELRLFIRSWEKWWLDATSFPILEAETQHKVGVEGRDSKGQVVSCMTDEDIFSLKDWNQMKIKSAERLNLVKQIKSREELRDTFKINWRLTVLTVCQWLSSVCCHSCYISL